MRDVFVGVHVMVDIILFLHDVGLPVREKTFDGNIEFLLVIR
jgi:hypothetical protein